MTAYATADDIAKLHGAAFVETLTERDEADGADVDLDRALAQASAEIDSYAGRYYTVPLASPPDFITRYCVDIAVYILSAQANFLTEQIEDRYEKIVAHLTKIANDKAVLPGQERIRDISEGDGEGAGGVMFESDAALFDRASTGDI
ncbi:MAG: DUF1320 family protein [Roseitalea sp.]|nr:DUF1320 family protein [Roseitalea sp.]MBO6950987.1 DUF1320 family protein [Rhizobiaceae bacterium]MBO6591026.1 DUF1320 family protein [Roseitalea sp.]MBO6599716.1 DUF1320 family protein [Roseitalea sp.]MBO6611472.1 DUF1320 family protein [Roseitalea sp.]